MDRNCGQLRVLPFAAVALRKESVDRNFQQAVEVSVAFPSLSARRAWIEIMVAIMEG